MTFVNFIFLINISFSYVSCEEKLTHVKWPLDCFLALSIKKTSPTSAPYALLDSWCQIYEDKLVQSPPPPPLFSLYLPKKCKEVAIKAKNHHQKIKLIKGNFLNSFL